jgi:hypothetical protein
MNKASMASSNIDRRKIPYQLPQPTGMVADIVAGGASPWTVTSRSGSLKPKTWRLNRSSSTSPRATT